MPRSALFFFLLLLHMIAASAQDKVIDRNSFSGIDAHVAKAGSLPEFPLKTIVDSITAPATDQYEQLRAIYVWIANYVGYDCSGYHHPNTSSGNASEALNQRKTTARGYADLFRQMCSIAHIHCETVQGLCKWQPRHIGDPDPPQHSWNVVRIDNTWFVADVTWGAGYTDERVRSFTKSFTDAWFLTDRELFALCHFPEDKKYQLLPEPVSKSRFVKAPIIGPTAAITWIVPDGSTPGNFRSREDSMQRFLFRMPQPRNVQSLSVSWDGRPAGPVEFYKEGNLLEVNILMPEEGEHTMTLQINNKPAFTYRAELARKKTVRKKS